MNDIMTRAEEQQLVALEGLVERHVNSKASAAAAIQQIRDLRLYRKNYGTFEEYCEKRWKVTRRWVTILIEASVVVQELTKEMGSAVPKLGDISVSAARALGNVPQELRPAVVGHINQAHKPMTSASIKEAEVVVRREKPAKVVLCDDTGYNIPEHLNPTWQRKLDLQPYLTALSDLIKNLKDGREREDPIIMKIHQSVLDDLRAAYAVINSAKLYCVCPFCGGWYEKVNKGVCRPCNSTGFVSKDQYERLLPEDQKKIRERAIENSTTKISEGMPRLHP